MTIEECVAKYIKDNKGKNKSAIDIKEELFEILKCECNYKLDVRTIRGKEIIAEIRERINDEQI